MWDAVMFVFEHPMLSLTVWVVFWLLLAGVLQTLLLRRQPK